MTTAAQIEDLTDLTFDPYLADEVVFGDLADPYRMIAGIRSENGRVVGLMPHPEHAIDALTGPSDDGLGMFYSAVDALIKA